MFVGMPHKGNFTARWNAGLASTGWPLAPFFHFQSGQLIDTARNSMVSKALQLGSKYIFFLDDDVILRNDTVALLYEAHLPVISGVYRSRSPPYEPVADIRGKAIETNMLGADKLLEVEHVGAGCLLVERRVFERLGRKLDEFICITNHTKDSGKWTLTYTYSEAVKNEYTCPKCGGLVIAKFFDYRLGKYKNNALSEDYYFSHQVRTVLNIPVFVHLRAVVDHEIGDNMYVNETGLVNRNSAAGELK